MRQAVEWLDDGYGSTPATRHRKARKHSDAGLGREGGGLSSGVLNRTVQTSKEVALPQRDDDR